jgi:N-acetylmuramoyl-L-alanine amidase
MLANKLSQLGADVYLTRTDDSSLLLDKRSGMIRKNNPDMSISIHHNSVAESSDFGGVSGALVLYSRETALPLAKSLAASLGAKTVKQSLNVCRDYRFPCVLIECGFVCNPSEYELLLTNEYKNDVCEKISATICEYFVKNS